MPGEIAQIAGQRRNVGHALAVRGATQPNPHRIEFAHEPRDIRAGVLDPVRLQQQPERGELTAQRRDVGRGPYWCRYRTVNGS